MMENTIPQQPQVTQEPPLSVPPPVIPQQKPSLNKILIAGIILAIVLVAGGYILLKSLNKPDSLPQTPPTVNNTQTDTVNNPPVSVEPTAAATGRGDVFDSESQAIEKDLNSLDSDMTSVDQGLNDEQIDLTQ